MKLRLQISQHGQQGQTLIETLVACFILVMGISAALGLATYSLRATGNIKQQTIGLGLAREGLEVVKNMRDTNWLRSALLSTDCYNFSDGSQTAPCYKDWLNVEGGYNISEGTYSLRTPVKGDLPWELVPTADEFGLDFSTGSKSGGGDIEPVDGGAAADSEIQSGGTIFYSGADGLPAQKGNSGFARKITITEDTFPPFDHAGDTGPRLKVTSQVWWSGRDCEMTEDVNPKKDCSVTLETYLTNWRVF